MRAPWNSPTDNKFSYTTLWLNLGFAVTLIRYILGDGQLVIGDFVWHPGEMESLLPAGVLGPLAGLYGYRRGQEKTSTTASSTPSDEEVASTVAGAR